MKEIFLHILQQYVHLFSFINIFQPWLILSININIFQPVPRGTLTKLLCNDQDTEPLPCSSYGIVFVFEQMFTLGKP